MQYFHPVFTLILTLTLTLSLTGQSPLDIPDAARSDAYHLGKELLVAVVDGKNGPSTTFRSRRIRADDQ